MDCPSFGSHKSTCTMLTLSRNNSSWLKPIVYPSKVGPSNSSRSRLKTGAPGIRSGESSMYSSKGRFFTLEPDRTICNKWIIISRLEWPQGWLERNRLAYRIHVIVLILLRIAAYSPNLRSSTRDRPSTVRRYWTEAWRPPCPSNRPPASTKICS